MVLDEIDAAWSANWEPTAPAPQLMDPGLQRACASWVERADARGIAHWLGRTLDADGLPKRLPVAAWWPALAALDAALRLRPGDLGTEARDRLIALVRSALRFTRPDGGAVFDPEPADPAARRDLLRSWADRLGEPSLAKVVGWWFPRRGADPADAPPPLPAVAADNRPLAMLRADWNRKGDLLAVNGRGPGMPDAIELVAAGARLLAPDWSPGPDARRATPTRWITGPTADLAEWTFRLGAARITRTAVLLRGRRLALLADQVDGADGPARFSLSLAPGVETGPVADSRALELRAGRTLKARALPIGLPAAGYATERGSLVAADGRLELTRPAGARRLWLPLLLSWDPARDRKPTTWRVLTVSERSRVCPPEAAFAARVGWGDGEGLVVYRSLARPALRAFLGHQTSARFLIGRFTRDGDVVPLVKVED